MNRRPLQLPTGWHGRLGVLPPFPGKLRAIDAAAKFSVWLKGTEHTAELWPCAPFHVDLSDRIQRQMWMGCYESIAATWFPEMKVSLV